MDEIGYTDNGSPVEALYTYVLDALGVPSEDTVKSMSGEHERFQKECIFSREWFDELFYDQFLLQNDINNWDYIDVINIIRKEVTENLDRHYR